MSDNNKKVALYIRVGTQTPSELLIELQRKECQKFCKDNNFNIIKEYIDVSPSSHASKRISFMKMITDSNKKEFQGVVYLQADRFSRNMKDYIDYGKKLKENGVELYPVRYNVIFRDKTLQNILEDYLKGVVING